jgi:hypothetical protein
MANEKKKTTSTVRALDRQGALTFCDHLLGDGRETFCTADAGNLYVGQIEDACSALKSARPKAATKANAEAKDAFRVHTNFGSAIWHGLQCVADCPVFDDAVREGATSIRDAFGPRAPSLRNRLAERIELTVSVRDDLREKEPALLRLPAAPGGGTFADWIGRWCDDGRRLTADVIGDRVARRARARVDPGPTAPALLSRLNALLLRARAALRDEIAYDVELPRDLEEKVFGLYDSLLEARQARAASRQARSETASSSSAPAPAPTDGAPTPA